VQIAEYVDGRRRIVTHVGSAHTEAELGLLLERARGLLGDAAQGELDLGIEPTPRKARLVTPATDAALFAEPTQSVEQPRVPAPQVVATSSRLLFDVLAEVFATLGFGAIGDETFRDLVIARIVEPTSILDTGRVLIDLGQKPASEKSMRRALVRAQERGYRDQIATACFNHVLISGDVSLCLYDVTTLYFEAEKEDDLRKVGYSKERRVDPQVVVGLLVDRHGFPLEIGCFEGNKAETATIVSIIKAFQDRHSLADMVVVADAGMLSASNLRELDEADLRFIVGSRATKAPTDLESHFRWHGDAFADGQVIDTLTPKNRRTIENDPKIKAEPVWNPERHSGSWRAVWAYSTKRAVRDNKTLTLQENRAREVVAGEKTARAPRFVKTSNGSRSLDEASLARARRLAGLKGYVTNIGADVMPRGRGHRQLPRPVARRAVLSDVQDRPPRPAHVPPHQGCDRGPPDHRVRSAGREPRGPEPDRTRDPQPHPTTASAALSHHRDQRHRADLPARHPHRQTGRPQRDQQQAAEALTRLTEVRSGRRQPAAEPPFRVR